MFKFKKIKIKKGKTFLKKAPRILAENFFLTFLFLSLFAVMLGVIIFYQYGINVKNENIDVSQEVLKFDQKTYQEVLAEWQKRNQEFSKTESQSYSDPFGQILE